MKLLPVGTIGSQISGGQEKGFTSGGRENKEYKVNG